jgi:RNase H-fold protein (predicted Holliday junction resolvase)
VRTFYSAWNEEKRNSIARALRNEIAKYQVGTIVLKIPKHHHCSRSINELVADIWQISERLGIRLTVCTISSLMKRYSDNPRSNKQALAQAIIHKYPNHKQLAHRHRKEHSNRSKKYHIRLFEAIACAELGTGH